MKLRWPEAHHLYLSPHPDDVVLSCGGTMYQQVQGGESVAVVTVFAASPSPSIPLSDFAKSLHERWEASAHADGGFGDAPAVRREEDQRAFARLDARIHVAHFPLTDCIYRVHPVTEEALYASEEAIFGEMSAADPALEALALLPPLPAETIVYCPLGVGHHVDHQVVRAVVDGWGLEANRVRYYEDYPYVTQAGALESVVGQHEGWIPVVTALSEAAVDAKIAAVAEHASQMSTFWESREAMAAALKARSAEVGGERMWISAGRP